MGSMAQWDNRKLVSHRSRVRLRAVLVFYLAFINNLVNDKSKHKNTMLYLYCIVRGPLIVMYNIVCDFLSGPFVSVIYIVVNIYICDF